MLTETETSAFIAMQAESGKPLRLAMQKLWLQGRVLPVGARIVVRHVFRSTETKPMEVIYAFALPRDAALRRFRVVGEGFNVHSELKPTEEAVKAYEKGIEEGHLSSLLRQYGDGVVNLTLGNIRPSETVAILLEILAGVEARDEGIRFRFPFTLAASYHSKVRAIEVEPGVGEIELPDEQFGDVVLPRYQSDASDLHEVGFELSICMAQPIAEIASPSHALRVSTAGDHRSRVALASDHDVPNRDLVLDVRTRHALADVLCGVDKKGKGRFAAIISSQAFGKAPDNPRRVVFVLDRSGSMAGLPMDQASKALDACLSALEERDEFGLVAFDDSVEVFRPSLYLAEKSARDAARNFLLAIRARGGTELGQGVSTAIKMLAGKDGDIMVLTDGQVFGTENILAEARRGGVRIHCLGIGNASQDRFLSLLARQTGGICRFLTARERVDLPSVELFASFGRPLAGSLRARVEGIPDSRVTPEPPPAVFSGTPVTVFGETGEPGQARLVVEWDVPGKGYLELPVETLSSELGESLRLLQGARLITDLESLHVLAEQDDTAKRREQGRVREQLRKLSESFGLASRSMSLVAVVERAGDQPGQLPHTVVVPVGMPQDVEFSSYFGTACQVGRPAARAHVVFSSPQVDAVFSKLGRTHESIGLPTWDPPSAAREHAAMGMMRDSLPRLQRILQREKDEPLAGGGAKLEPEEALLELARQIEPDGGLPGNTDFQRLVHTLLALLTFLHEGHTATVGAFRLHVHRLIRFLETQKLPKLDEEERRTARNVLRWARAGGKVPWNLQELLQLQHKEQEAWGQIRKIAALPESASSE